MTRRDTTPQCVTVAFDVYVEEPRFESARVFACTEDEAELRARAIDLGRHRFPNRPFKVMRVFYTSESMAAVELLETAVLQIGDPETVSADLACGAHS
jgi:hypothetical protein